MNVPERIGAAWLAGLTDAELQQVESELRDSFAREETTEKARRGARYDMMSGPPALTNAWVRWSMASKAARERGLRVPYRH